MKIMCLFLCLTLFVFSSSQGYSQEGNKAVQSAKEKIKRFKIVDSRKAKTAVAGIRGAEEKEEDTLFWSGKDSVTKEELDLFNVGLEKSEKGEKAGAKSAFQIFLNKYPKSVLAPNAFEILKTLE